MYVEHRGANVSKQCTVALNCHQLAKAITVKYQISACTQAMYGMHIAKTRFVLICLQKTVMHTYREELAME